MLFTLTICFLLLLVLESVQNFAWKGVLVVGLIFLTQNCDWGLMAPIFTLLFACHCNSRRELMESYLGAVLLFALAMYSPHKSLADLLGGCVAVAMSGVVIL